MRPRVTVLIIVIAAILAFSLGRFANRTRAAGENPATAKAAGAHPDLSGIWQGRNQPLDFNNPDGPGVGTGQKNWFGKPRVGGGFGFLDAKSEQPSMLPWAAARYKATREGAYEWFQPLKPVEPALNCLPSNMPWVYDDAQLAPFEIIQFPNRIVELFQTDGHWRQIFLDGRKNPEGAPDTFMGYSTGRWEGDTLVAETVGIKDLTWIDRLGHPHSDALRVEERIRRVSPKRLDVDLTFDDPKTYTKPWKGKKIYYLQKSDITEAFTCEDIWQEEYPKKVRKLIGDLKGPQ